MLFFKVPIFCEFGDNWLAFVTHHDPRMVHCFLFLFFSLVCISKHLVFINWTSTQGVVYFLMEVISRHTAYYNLKSFM